MHQTLCEQTVAVSFEAETNAGMAFETYGNPWDVRESAMNDTHSPGSGSMSLIQQLYVLFLSHTHTHNLSCSFFLWASLGFNGCHGDGCSLKMASLYKQIWGSQRRTLRNIYSLTRHRALLRSTHGFDTPIFWIMRIERFKYISGLHCVLTRCDTIRFQN